MEQAQALKQRNNQQQRLYFQDGVVDQLHLSDRIFQHIILKQIRSTFPHIMNPNCFHLCGPLSLFIKACRKDNPAGDYASGLFMFRIKSLEFETLNYWPHLACRQSRSQALCLTTNL